ncbi:MAG: hypothetical protein ACXVBY_08950 [Isosphaeraceae bacterium]
MLPSHPPLGLDFGAIGFQSKQSPDQNVTSLDRTQQQAVRADCDTPIMLARTTRVAPRITRLKTL